MVPLKPKVIHLAPEHHPLPVCPDFEDFNAVLAFEQAMRTHRAHVEAFDVTPLDGRVDGAWQVSNQRGRSYTVDIVDDSGQHDACTCPDFLEGELGLCKHLEAVKRTLRARPALHRAYRALSAHPIRPTLTVHAAGGLSLHRLGAWPPHALAALGLPAHPTPLQSHSPLLQPGPLDLEGVRLTHAARPAAARLQARARLQQRTRSFLQAFEDGKVGVDVLNKPLFPYQRTGVVHLAAHGRALLADDMGLGKTVQAMAACEIMRARGEVDRVLIVAPASIKHQWARELEAYTGRQVVVVGGPPAQRAAALASSAPYKIISYEATWRDLSRLQALDTDLLILDEAQRAKNFRTRTAATLKAIPSRFLFVLTGTPIENRLDDLYALLQLVDPQILGPLWRFNFNHHKQGPTAKVLGCKHLSQLRETLAPILLRRRKEAVLDQLPALTEQTRYTALTVAQVDYEEACRAEAARYMALSEKRPLTLVEQQKLLAALLKARQACNALELADPGAVTPASPKLDEFEAYVAEIAAGGASKILVFSEWVGMLKLAGARLDKLGLGWLMLTGEVPQEHRPALLDRFRADPSRQILLSSDAGGIGLNLQVANYVVHLDLPWNPARLDQRTARAHRLGQTRGVSVTYLCAESGIERGIEGTLAGKRAVRAAALELTSDVEELENQSFSVFLRQLRTVIEELAPPNEGILPGETGDLLEPPPPRAADLEQEPEPPVDTPAPQAHVAAPPVPLPVPVPVPVPATPPSIQAPPQGNGQPPRPSPGHRAHDRLRLAHVVLEAGFPGDAVKAAYEALAAGIATLIPDGPPPNHDALVASIYRDLVPTGKLGLAVPGILARLHDLGSLERMGVAVDPTLASDALAEVGDWVGRF